MSRGTEEVLALALTEALTKKMDYKTVVALLLTRYILDILSMPHQFWQISFQIYKQQHYVV